MNKWKILLLLGGCFVVCTGKRPFIVRKGAINYMVYYQSWYRGICSGFLVSKTVVMTAAVCITNPFTGEGDTRPINVVTGTNYRHPKRGVRVPVVKILYPSLINVTHNRAFMIQRCPALLLLKRIIPDTLTEIPLRPVSVDYLGDVNLKLQEQCIIMGWHFFHKGDMIYPVNKFLLQKTLRAQYMIVTKKTLWCEALYIKMTQILDDLGFRDPMEKRASICVKDPDRQAQPCHGMYGAPLICRGRAVGMMMAPDAQWVNCTGNSNLIHLFVSGHLRSFMSCVSSLFDPDASTEWNTVLDEDADEKEYYDFIPSLYDKVVSDSESDE